MTRISKIEFRPLEDAPSRFDYFIDGRPLYEQLPDLVEPAKLSSIPEQFRGKYELLMKRWCTTPIGHCSPDWQLRTLNQLLLRQPPDLPDGRRRIYLCWGDCECEHLSCFIEMTAGIVTWRGFSKGSPRRQSLEHFESGKWTRVPLVAGQSKGRELSGGPFYFDEGEYRTVLEPIRDVIRDAVSNRASMSPRHRPEIAWTHVDSKLTQMARELARTAGLPFQRAGGE